MHWIVVRLGDASATAGSMTWQITRSLILGTALSAAGRAADLRDIIGLLIAGAVAAWVPVEFWNRQMLTMVGASPAETEQR